MVAALILPWFEANTNAIGIDLGIDLSLFHLLSPTIVQTSNPLQIPATLVVLVALATAGFAFMVARRSGAVVGVGLLLQLGFGLALVFGGLLLFSVLTMSATSGTGMLAAFIGFGPAIGLFLYTASGAVGLVAVRRLLRMAPVAPPAPVDASPKTSADSPTPTRPVIRADNQLAGVAGLVVVVLLLLGGVAVLTAGQGPLAGLGAVVVSPEPTVPEIIAPERAENVWAYIEACAGGDMYSCDWLYNNSDAGTADEAFGASCGNAAPTPQNGNCASGSWEATLEPIVAIPGRAWIEASVREAFDAYWPGQHRMAEILDLEVHQIDPVTVFMCVTHSYDGLEGYSGGTGYSFYRMSLIDASWSLGENYLYPTHEECMEYVAGVRIELGP